MTLMFSHDTIAAVATPPGEGGIAVIRVSGPEARAIADRVFRSQKPKDLHTVSGYTVHYGHLMVRETGETVDDGLLTIFSCPHSYTGEDVVELSCHGGRASTARALQLVLHAGARLAEPGEFTQRAFLNGRIDLAQAEAVADVIRARTESARRLAHRQLEGALSRTVMSLKDTLIGILASIEVTIDFSDEVGELEYEPLQARMEEVLGGVEQLLATADTGRILREGLRIAIVGRPNVGKSSLLNALLRSERAIVTPIAGTTRDLVEESANIRGIPVVLVDTAGIRETEDVVERIGVERAQNAAISADVILLVIDVSEGLTETDWEVARRLAGTEAEKGSILLVCNKCDAVTPERRAETPLWQTRLPFLPEGMALVSAQTGEGLERLETLLLGAGVSGIEGDASVTVANERHRQALEAARQSLQAAADTAQQRLPGDFVAIDVRGALDALGQITGETLSEEIIHRIFRDFCVGK